MNKVAKVTIYFWIMKMCATTLGETAGDLLSMTMNVGYGVSSVILISLFFISLVSQLKSNRFNPLLYWTVILQQALPAQQCPILWTARSVLVTCEVHLC